jgi:hypothetical protein
VTIVDDEVVTGDPDDPETATIDCPDGCTAELAAGRSIALRAEPAEGSLFLGWSAETCPVAATCTVAGDEDLVLVPRFEPAVQLVVALDPTAIPDIVVAVGLADAAQLPLLEDLGPGEACTDECSYRLPVGTTLTLTAIESEAWFLEAWDTAADCDGSAEPCQLTLLEDLTVLARFEPRIIVD